MSIRTLLLASALVLIVGSLGSRLDPLRGRKSAVVDPAARVVDQRANRAWSTALHPFGFLENRGQWDASQRYAARARDLTAHVQDDGIVLARHVPDRGAHVLRLEMAANGSRADVTAEGPASAPHHFLIGSDRSRWARHVTARPRVRMTGLAPGVDLLLREARRRPRGLEYELHLAAGVDPAEVSLRLAGATGPLRVAESGALETPTSIDPLIQSAPVAWQESADGTRRLLACAYRLDGVDRFGFTVEGRDPNCPLIIDPELDWSTWYGGSVGEVVNELAADEAGGVVLAGRTRSMDLPGSSGSFDPTLEPQGPFFPQEDGMVFRMDAEGGLLWSSYLGGAEFDEVRAVAIALDGDIHLAGSTGSSDFPSTPGAYDESYDTFTDGFLSRVSADGTELVASTFLGGPGSGIDEVRAIALAPGGDVIAAVRTDNPGFPVTSGAFDETHNSPGGPDAVVMRLDGMLSTLQWSTFLGAEDNDSIRDVTVGPDDAVYVTGGTSSDAFPTTPEAFQSTPGPGAFVTCLAPDGGSLLFSTMLRDETLAFGGASGRSIALGPQGDVYVAGTTTQLFFPTTPDAFAPVKDFSSSTDGFVTRMDPRGSELVYSTFLGGFSGLDDLDDLVVDSSGAAIVAGSTNSADWPVTPGAYDTTVNTIVDLYISKLSPDGSTLLYSTFLGGNGIDSPGSNRTGLARTPDGAVVVSATSHSADYPITPGAFQARPSSPDTVVVTRLRLLPAGATSVGASTPGCAGLLQAEVDAMPVASAEVTLQCLGGPPGGIGVLVVAEAALSTPVPVGGADLWLDPATIRAMHPLHASELGVGRLRVRVPDQPGATAYLQYLWHDPCAPGGLSASDALEIVVQ